MKTAAILFMLFGVFLILGLGVMSLLGFAMSFDAPGSESDPVAWMNRVLIFVLPLIVLMLVLIFAWISFRKGNYVRSFWIGSFFGITIAIGFILTVMFSFVTMGQLKGISMQNAEKERLYPVQKFIRPVDGGADTILVFPTGMLAYRLYRKDQFPPGGYVGDLNHTRDTILVDFGIDTLLKQEELYEFLDSQGRKLSDVFVLRNRWKK